MDRILVIFLVTVLTACGGGGGGGDSSSPAAVDDPQPHETDMRTGIFTDGPVSGLRYVQGELEDITNDLGEFTYDANSNAPVQFYVGNVLLGGARGQAVVTPYDLSSAGRAASLQSGFNISRFLISLDSSDDPDIQLPSNIGLANGSLDFTLSTGVFESNDQVQRLVQFYSESDLVSVADTEQHLQSNPHVQSDIAELQSQASNYLPTIDLSWDNTLQEAGPIFQMETSNGEYLVVFVQPESEGSPDFHISQVIHVGQDNVFTAFKLNRNNIPTFINANGNIYSYVSQSMGSFERFAQSVATYDHARGGMLYDGSGGNHGLPTSNIDISRIADMENLLSDFNSAGFLEEEKIHLLDHVMTIVEGLRCAYLPTSQCSTLSTQVLSFIKHTPEQMENFINIHDQLIDLTQCVELFELLVGNSNVCDMGATLDEILIVLNRVYQGYENESDILIDEVQVPVHFAITSLPYHYLYSEAGTILDVYAEVLSCDANIQRVQFADGTVYIKVNSLSGCWWGYGECYYCLDADPPASMNIIKSKSQELIQQVFVGYGVLATDVPGDNFGFDYFDLALANQVSIGNPVGFFGRYMDYMSPYVLASSDNNSSRYIFYYDFGYSGSELNYPKLMMGLDENLNPRILFDLAVESGGYSYLLTGGN